MWQIVKVFSETVCWKARRRPKTHQYSSCGACWLIDFCMAKTKRYQWREEPAKIIPSPKHSLLYPPVNVSYVEKKHPVWQAWRILRLGATGMGQLQEVPWHRRVGRCGCGGDQKGWCLERKDTTWSMFKNYCWNVPLRSEKPRVFVVLYWSTVEVKKSWNPALVLLCSAGCIESFIPEKWSCQSKMFIIVYLWKSINIYKRQMPPPVVQLHLGYKFHGCFKVVESRCHGTTFSGVRKRHLTREIRQSVANIQIRPEATPWKMSFHWKLDGLWIGSNMFKW